ncbi:MFS transporter [Aquirhabdus parva]|uniref:MFS transporter n=1 Tax=Aquirhabdus parva TaxID=2283318 RepID=A0A345PA25_9GAMM|nr:MFS transporter [Aquirhabdus parva]AXI04134.1 MFS transporter [Aquirhabdus parva]
MTERRLHGKNVRHPLLWLFIVQMLSMGAMEMSAPFWALHFKATGQLSAHWLAIASGVAYAGPMVMAMCFTPLWGRLGDRYGHKPMLLRALFALALTQLCIAWLNDTFSILVMRLVQGGLAGFIAASQAYGTTLVNREGRSALMAKLQVATAMGSMIGPLLGGIIFDFYSFAWLNLIAALICFGCALAAWWLLPATQVKKVSKSSEATTEVSLPFAAFFGLLLGIVLVQAGKMMPQAFFGIFAEQTLHASATVVGLCYGAVAVGLCVAAPIWGKRFAHQSQSQVLQQVEWITWVCVLVVMAQAMSSNIVIFIVARVVWGICLGALLPVFYSLLSKAAADHQQGHVLGLGNSAAKAGALIGIGVGAVTMIWLPVAYLFWPVVVTYGVAALGIRLLRLKPQVFSPTPSASLTNPS